MSSTNDTHQHLFVHAPPKSILKKSPSPRFLDSTMNFENNQYPNIILSSNYENEKNDIDENLSNNNHMCIFNDNRSVKKDNSELSPLETLLPMTLNENSCQYNIDVQSIETIPSVKSNQSLLSSSRSSDDEPEHQQKPQNRVRIKSKRNYYRPFVIDDALSSSASSSDNNDERKARRTMIESKTTSVHSQAKDMQLDEFIRKYQQRGGIHLPIMKEYHIQENKTRKDLINTNANKTYDFPFIKQENSHVDKNLIMNDTLNLLGSIDKMTLSSKSLSPLQLLFDVARTNELDRRTKIDRIRQYVEEQIGITAFLTIYKLIKSSQMPIDIQRKPFCYYANFIPHLCCLIMLESEQQKTRL